MYKHGSLPTPRHLNEPKLLLVIDFLWPKWVLFLDLEVPGISFAYSPYTHICILIVIGTYLHNLFYSYSRPLYTGCS